MIDWMIQLPEALEQVLWAQVQEIEEAKKMPYVTSVERIGIEKGLKQGIEKGIEKGIERGVVVK